MQARRVFLRIAGASNAQGSPVYIVDREAFELTAVARAINSMVG